MARSGLTLLELLIALALMAALVGVVTPMVANRAKPMQFEETLRNIRSAAAWCRADARRTGEPVEFAAVVMEDGRTALLGLTFGATSEAPLSADLIVETESAEAQGSGGAGTPRRQYLLLPVGYRLTREEDLGRLIAELAESEDAFLPPPEVDEEEAVEGARITVAIFLPDGGAIVGAPVRLEARQGRAAMLTFNAWTGDAVVTPLAEPAGERVEEESEEDEELLPTLEEPGAEPDDAGNPERAGRRRSP